MKKIIAGIATFSALAFATAIPSLAATVDLPPEFDSIAPIFEIALKIIEFISKIIGLFN